MLDVDAIARAAALADAGVAAPAPAPPAPAPPLPSDEELDVLGVAALRELITRADLSHADCVEKAELRARAAEALVPLRAAADAAEARAFGDDGDETNDATAGGDGGDGGRDPLYAVEADSYGLLKGLMDTVLAPFYRTSAAADARGGTGSVVADAFGAAPAAAAAAAEGSDALLDAVEPNVFAGSEVCRVFVTSHA